MGIVVSKFGGSSLADAAGVRRCMQILSSRRRRRFIVLSAPGRRFPGDAKITDLLCTHTEEGLSAVRARLAELARALGVKLERGLLEQSLSLSASPERLASRGEYLVARVFSEFAQLPFVDAAELFHFDDRGRLLKAETAKSIRKMALKLHSAVIPGFYGSRPDGEIALFPRGGSDITGALLAAYLQAGIYENWTDVDGLMSADPELCPDAICHPLASYSQMEAIARAGANVLHPDCLKPLMESGVPLVMRNTFSPAQPGTYVSDSVRRSVCCVCAQSGYGLLESSDPGVTRLLEQLGAPEFLNAGGKRVYPVRDYGALAIITAFGLSKIKPPADCAAIAREEGCARFLVREEQKTAAVRMLHAQLLSSPQPPRAFF